MIEKKGGIDKLESKARHKYLKSRSCFTSDLGCHLQQPIFSLFGVVLAIQDDRKARFGIRRKSDDDRRRLRTFMSFKFLAEKGVIPAPLGVWFPNIVMVCLQASGIPKRQAPSI